MEKDCIGEYQVTCKKAAEARRELEAAQYWGPWVGLSKCWWTSQASSDIHRACVELGTMDDYYCFWSCISDNSAQQAASYWLSQSVRLCLLNANLTVLSNSHFVIPS